MTGTTKTLLLLPRIKIHNANALSSPYTIGFPAVTGWMGFVHALQRSLNDKGYGVACNGLAIVSHHMDLQTYRGADDFVSSIIGTANPLNKDGSRPSFIEEARCHLEASLLVELSESLYGRGEEFLEAVARHMARLKIAGGDIEGQVSPEIMCIENGNSEDVTRVMGRLMPGYALLERRDLMLDAMAQGQDAMEALLDYLAVHHVSEKEGSEKEQPEAGSETGVEKTGEEKNAKSSVVWHRHRRTFQGKPVGWIVPIATGFHGITPVAQAENQRDPQIPHRFAESLVTLGEFKMPCRLSSVESLLWRYHFDELNDLYLCQQASSGGQEMVDETSSYEEDDEFAGTC